MLTAKIISFVQMIMINWQENYSDHDNTLQHTTDSAFSKINESSHSLVRLFSQHSTPNFIIFNKLPVFNLNR